MTTALEVPLGLVEDAVTDSLEVTQELENRGFRVVRLGIAAVCEYPNLAFAFGSIAFVSRALEAVGSRLPLPDPYPADLSQFLGRHIKKANRKELVYAERPFFVKTANFFKGVSMVVRDGLDFLQVPDGEALYVSETVSFVAEYRVYIIDGQRRGPACCYRKGEPEGLELDETLVNNAVRMLPENTSCVYDFGVLSDGRTVLVERNEGFSVGRYTPFDISSYVDLLMARWQQLAPPPPMGNIA
jgi:hypothetical protein